MAGLATLQLNAEMAGLPVRPVSALEMRYILPGRLAFNLGTPRHVESTDRALGICELVLAGIRWGCQTSDVLGGCTEEAQLQHRGGQQQRCLCICRRGHGHNSRGNEHQKGHLKLSKT